MENYEVETVDYLNDNFNAVEKELEKITANELIKIEIDGELETAIKELELLKTQMPEKQTATLLEMCKDNVIETVFGQFGLSALFLSSKDGGNVTTLHNFEKGKVDGTWVVNERDRDKWDVWNHTANEGGFKEKRSLYDVKKNQMRAADRAAGKTAVKDEYTGNTISIKRADIDHVVSAKEIEGSAKNNLFLSQEKRVELGTSDVNLAYTKDKANRSKGSKSMETWLDKERADGRTNEQAFGIDRNLAMAKDNAARKYMNKEITKAQFKKYSTELIATGGKDAAMMVATSAFGVILRDLCSGIMTEVRITFEKKGTESFKEIFRRFKARLQSILSELKHKWREILPASFGQGIIAFLSNIVVFVINLFATTLKKIVMMIRAGFVSLCEAVKMLAHPPAGMTREEANFQAMKILTAGLIGAASLGLSAAIEKLLQSIPGLQPLMMFPIPSFGGELRTVSDILAVTISSLVGGVISTIVLYFMDRARENAKRCKWQIQMVAQSGVVVQCQIAKTWCTLDEGYRFLYQKTEEMYHTFNDAKHTLDESSAAGENKISELDNVMEKLRNI